MHKLPGELEELAALVDGDVPAFDAIYRRYYRSVYANIFKLVKNAHYAEDILQDVFVSLWQNRFKIRSDRSVSGWLFVVSYNRALTFLKREIRRSEEYVESYEPFESSLADEEPDESVLTMQLNALEEAVESLSTRRREVFRLCRFEGKTNEEAATMLNLSTETVKDYLKHSIKAVKAYIGDKYPPHVVGMMLLTGLFAN